MNTTKKLSLRILVMLALGIGVGLSGTVAWGDDLNPAPYRGGPLSVFAHWNLLPGTTFLNLTTWSSVDDNNPATFLYPNFTPTPVIQPQNDIYQWQVPNFVDDLPVKYMRLQLTWAGAPQPPVNLFSQGLDGVNPLFATITNTSVPQFLASGYTYQYYDLEFHPNPDFERFHVQVAPNSYLVQAVVDTISIPEPATLSLLALGGLLWRRRTA